MTSHNLALSLSMLVILMPSIALTDDRNAAPRPFSVHDVDRDGYLDRREYTDIQQRRRMRLEQQEGRGWRRLGALPGFDEIDRNADGKISVEELGEALGQGRGLRPRRRDGSCRDTW